MMKRTYTLCLIGLMAMLLIPALAPYSLFGLFTGQARAQTITAASCEYADVKAAVDAAQSGDTVIVPQGTAIWSDTLTITKGIILKGAGIEQTTITSNTPDLLGGIITYAPASPALNEHFRITGFTLDGNYRSNGIYLCNYTATIINRVRIDHNRIVKPGGAGAGRCIYIRGTVYGVADNNIVGYGEALDSYGAGKEAWEHLPRDFGNENNFYFEDNVVIGDHEGHFGHEGGQGGRYVARYNDYSGYTSSEYFALFDAHGNQGDFGTMVVEIYGNKINMGAHNGMFFDQRGGQALVFMNKVTAPPGYTTPFRVREEFVDTLEGFDYPQHVMNSYYWNNRINNLIFATEVPVEASGTAVGGGSNYLDYGGGELYTDNSQHRLGIALYEGTGSGQVRHIINGAFAGSNFRITVSPNWDVNPDATTKFRTVLDCSNAVHENSEYFNYSESFTGSAAVNSLYGFRMETGMGAGPLANRPAHCDLTGMAYWATEQPVDTIDDNSVGCHPARPISGTLYKWNGKDWEAYYTPYTYPHPLTLTDIAYGDVNGDGTIDAYDAALVAKHSVGLVTLTAEQQQKAEVSGDGLIDAYDAALIAKKAVGLIEKFPVEGG